MGRLSIFGLLTVMWIILDIGRIKLGYAADVDLDWTAGKIAGCGLGLLVHSIWGRP